MKQLDIDFLEKTSPWKNKIHFFETIDSTNSYALKLGESGAPEGTFVVAEIQTQGRGQFHRSWSSPPESGLWLSLLLRLPVTQEIIPALAHFAVVALCDAIEELGIKIKNLSIKEPNDLLIGGKKVAGVLVETRVGKNSFAVVGIGVNIYQQVEDFPEEIREKATSLALASPGAIINRQELAMHFIEALYNRYQQLHHDTKALEDAWREKL